MLEAEIAAASRLWMSERGLDVHEEVDTPFGRPDLVGAAFGEIVVVESKVGFGLNVIWQACRWLERANEVWVAVKRPVPPRVVGRRRAHASWRPGPWNLGFEICADRGIGVLSVRDEAMPGLVVSHELDAMRREPKQSLREYLRSEQKGADCAGTNRGGYVTDFKLTADRLASYVLQNPGATLGQVVLSVEHHYSTKRGAIVSLSELLNRDRHRPKALAGVRIEGKGRTAKLYPVDTGTF